jgi:hypothetical protein
MRHSKIAALQNLLAGQQAGSLVYDLTSAQIAALQGETSKSRFLLAEALLQHNPELFRSLYSLAKALQAAILIQDLRQASDLLNRRFKTKDWFNVHFEDGDVGLVAAPVWEVTSADRSIFWLNRAILDINLEGFEFILTRWSYALPVFARYYHSPSKITGRVAINVGDSARVPGLAFCSNRSDTFLIPDAIYIASSGYADMRLARGSIDWHERHPVAYWRGGTSGQPTDRRRGWRTLPRVTLCDLSRENSTVLDAGITHIAQIPREDDENDIRASGLMRPFVDPSEFRKFKYQIDIDGNTNSWSGLFQKLLTGSPVVKVASQGNYRQWYYDRLRPWINFVPVCADMSDLIEKLDWLRCNDDVARRIGEQGWALADSLRFEEELTRAGKNIGAALLYSKGDSETTVEFGSEAEGNVCLEDGWVSEKSGAIALGCSSTIVLPRPITSGDFIIELTAYPVSLEQPTAPQRALILANGELIIQQEVKQRQVLRGRIPAITIARAESLLIHFLHPDGVRVASSSCPLDGRIVSLGISEMKLTPVANYLKQEGLAHNHEILSRDEQSGVGAQRSSLRVKSRPTRQGSILDRLYGYDIWQGFLPNHPRESVVQGWNGNHPAFLRLIDAVPNHIFIDVGSWKGQSTIFVADIMRRRNLDGCVISIDTFLGSFEHWSPGKELFSRNGGRPDLFNSFMDNVFYYGVADYVVPMPQISTTAAQILSQFGIQAGIVHIDAAQDYKAVLADAEAFWPLIGPGGYLIGDDYHETWPSVMRAADDFAAKVGLSLVVDMPKWILQKPGIGLCG